MEGGAKTTQQEQWTRWRSNLQSFLQHELAIPVEKFPRCVILSMHADAPRQGRQLDLMPSLQRFVNSAPARLRSNCTVSCLRRVRMDMKHWHIREGFYCQSGRGNSSRTSVQPFVPFCSHPVWGKSCTRLSARNSWTSTSNSYIINSWRTTRTPVTLGCHQVRAFQRLCVSKGQPSALLFIDLQEAFYRVLRPLVVDGPVDDESAAAMAARIDLDDGFLHDLHAALQQPCALEEAGIPSHLRRAIRALHTDTFFKLPMQTDQVVTQIGTRPGDSFADVIFGFLMAKVLRKFQQAMDAEGLLMQLPEADSLSFEGIASEAKVSFVGPCWMDDLCVCLTAAMNEQLHSAVGFATE